MSRSILREKGPFVDFETKNRNRRLTFLYPSILPVFRSICSLWTSYYHKNWKTASNIHIDFNVVMKSIENLHLCSLSKPSHFRVTTNALRRSYQQDSVTMPPSHFEQRDQKRTLASNHRTSAWPSRFGVPSRFRVLQIYYLYMKMYMLKVFVYWGIISN